MNVGLLLVGHGTHHAAGVEQFLALARLVANRLDDVPVEPAFLEIQSPTIDDGVRQLLERGVRRIVIVPALLFAAGHAKHDVPAAVAAAVGDAPDAVVQQAAHFGCQREILELSRRRYEQTVVDQGDIAPAETCLVLVGRGSRDESATAEMHEFARLRHEQTGVAETAVGFIAMAQPSLREVLERVAAEKYRRIVVQPHLLFSGDMQLDVAREVNAIARAHSDQQWLVAPVLGSDVLTGGDAAELLPAAVIDSFERASELASTQQMYNKK